MKRLTQEQISDLLEKYQGRVIAFCAVIRSEGTGLGITEANEAGYFPVPFSLYHCELFDDAQREADRINRQFLKLSDETAELIIASSICAGKIGGEELQATVRLKIELDARLDLREQSAMIRERIKGVEGVTDATVIALQTEAMIYGSDAPSPNALDRVLYNCCKDGLPPDWSMYDAIEIAPCREHGVRGDGYTERCEPDEAQFWTVYGHLTEGGCEALTDCEDEATARDIGALFQNYFIQN